MAKILSGYVVNITSIHHCKTEELNWNTVRCFEFLCNKESEFRYQNGNWARRKWSSAIKKFIAAAKNTFWISLNWEERLLYWNVLLARYKFCSFTCICTSCVVNILSALIRSWKVSWVTILKKSFVNEAKKQQQLQNWPDGRR